MADLEKDNSVLSEKLRQVTETCRRLEKRINEAENFGLELMAGNLASEIEQAVLKKVLHDLIKVDSDQHVYTIIVSDGKGYQGKGQLTD